VVIETPAGTEIAAREQATYTLAYDARYLSFDHAGAFMSSVQRRVEHWREIC
jgi:pyruvate/2-oxoglutarate dehydrogenase complex dihydrolipoamide acyltransferase (E2) component